MYATRTIQSYYPPDVCLTEVFERYSCSEKAFLATLQQMVIEGVSTRKVRRVLEELCEEAWQECG